MRIMAIDYGDAHTGVAISDPTGFLTGVTTTIHSRKAEVVLSELARLVKEHQVDQLVMGFPPEHGRHGGPRPDSTGRVAQQIRPPAWSRYCGTSGAPPWTPTAFWPRGAKMRRSGRKPWTRWPLR